MLSRFAGRRALIRSVLAGAGTALLPRGNTARTRDPRFELTTPRVVDTSATGELRRQNALFMRQRAALAQSQAPLPNHITNGDEDSLPNYIGQYSKGLPHSQIGEVDAAAYEALLKACASGKSSDFAAIPRGSGRKLISPQGGFAFSIEGGDSHSFYLEPPPALSSAAKAAEMVELYWQALCRDIPFDDYPTSPLIARAAVELSQLSDFRGPRDSNNMVTPANIFRGLTQGDLKGHPISQFLLKPIPTLSTRFPQKARVGFPDYDYMTSPDEWSLDQAGLPPFRDEVMDPYLRYIRNGRDLAQWVHYDYIHQGHQNAMLIITDFAPESVFNNSTYPLSPSNPYRNSKTEAGWVTFGLVQIAGLLGVACQEALRAAWYQKWRVHRTLRPEATGGRLHYTLTGEAHYPLHPELTHSDAVALTYAKYGSYLLPQAYVEGCPCHPAYPSGHATVAGACSALLKAFFNEQAIVPDPVIPSSDGLSLVPYTGPALTVGDEINKLAFNLGMGRNWAGIHYRSDAVGGNLLGEEVAISILRDAVGCMTEDFEGFKFTKMNGDKVTIAPSPS